MMMIKHGCSRTEKCAIAEALQLLLHALRHARCFCPQEWGCMPAASPVAGVALSAEDGFELCKVNKSGSIYVHLMYQAVNVQRQLKCLWQQQRQQPCPPPRNAYWWVRICVWLQLVDWPQTSGQQRH